ncbi:glycoside hydrolase family 65 protein [Streptomyces chattanoogensis]|uniref:Trehalose 6-phosphate phosphorylase n=1 Tax=Streptomyces chattanoogensis TaxID=66876 RepID=A0A0N0XRQ9_9ACTN|nr:glycosyl hydrolase family 65 protein [Streptomyces chattanoogensis]KPC58587.1 trehalose 6-phosphate phosphorylase [Streptomyces chattanoogensis]
MDSGWTWSYEGYDPKTERLRETLCTLGNGYFATRGAATETLTGPSHYPGTYAAGCYNRLTSTVAGRQVENEDMVNLPNWLPLRYRMRPSGAPPGPWLSPDHEQLAEYRQTLDLRHGTLTRWSTYEDGDGRRLKVKQTRFVHMEDPHLAALRTLFTADGWAGEVEVSTGIDGDVHNHGVARYRALASRHLGDWECGREGGDTVWLSCRTLDSDVRIALAARVQVGSGRGVPPRTTAHTAHAIGQRLRLPVLGTGGTAVVDKTVTLYTSRDPAIGSPLEAAVDGALAAPEFPRLLATHRAAWEHLWQRADLEVPGEAGGILRLHLFHVLQTLSPHTAELDVGVPARGLHGEAYRGHVFWDELFVLPFLNLHLPEVSRALLDYRHRRLPAACRAAREAGRTGAMYPWQSGSDGREETQQMHLNPRSGRWLPDHSHLQHHVGSAVAYNIWQYCQASGDTEFLYGHGAEMLLQIARFWADCAAWDPAIGRYRIRGVVGPDEYHDGYPDAAEPGLDDNAYTNVTAAWVLMRALDLGRTLPEACRRELCERKHLGEEDLARWEDIAHRLYVPYDRGVISQFAGYQELRELDWAGYRGRYGDIRRLDRILEAEGDTVNRYQASKQADVLMLGYLFSPGELTKVFRQLGYALDDDIWRHTVEYYLCRTSHGSTLSALVHAWVLSRVRHNAAWSYCEEALTGDVADLQGGTTTEGIHLGAMAGTLDLVQRGMTGLETRDGALWLAPAPLPQLSKFAVRIRYRRHWDIGLQLRAERVRVAVPDGGNGPVHVRLGGRLFTVAPGTTRWLDLPTCVAGYPTQ